MELKKKQKKEKNRVSEAVVVLGQTTKQKTKFFSSSRLLTSNVFDAVVMLYHFIFCNAFCVFPYIVSKVTHDG